MSVAVANWMRWWILPLSALGIILLLVAPIGLGPTKLAHAIENTFHVPLFAVVAIGLLLWLRSFNGQGTPNSAIRVRSGSWKSQYVLALLLALALGTLGELAQSFTGSRRAEWLDLLNDFLGAVAGLSLYALNDKRRRLRSWLRRLLVVGIAAVVFIAAVPVAHLGLMYWQRWQQLPELGTWESSGQRFVTPSSAELRVVFLPPPWSTTNDELALQMSPLRDSRWFGIVMEEPYPDWSGYSQLAIELVNPNDLPVDLSLRINDRAHNNEYADRFNRNFSVPALQRMTLLVPLSQIQAAPARQLNLDKIAKLALFQDAERGARALYVRSIRLVP